MRKKTGKKQADEKKSDKTEEGKEGKAKEGASSETTRSVKHIVPLSSFFLGKKSKHQRRTKEEGCSGDDTTAPSEREGEETKEPKITRSESRIADEQLGRRLDSLSRLLEGNGICAAVCFDGEKILISNNNLTVTNQVKKGGNETQDLIVDVMQYFADYANCTKKDARLKVHNGNIALFGRICKQYVKGQLQTGYEAFFDTWVLRLAEWKFANHKSMAEMGINRLYKLADGKDGKEKEKKLADVRVAAFFGAVSIVIDRIYIDIKKVEKGLNPEAKRGKFDKEVIAAFKLSANFKDVRGGHGCREYSEKIYNSEFIELSEEKRDKSDEKKVDYGYELLHIRGKLVREVRTSGRRNKTGEEREDVDDNKKTHAEMQILQRLYDKRMTGVVQIGISKLCCPDCSCTIEAVNQCTTERQITEVTEGDKGELITDVLRLFYRGRHLQFFSNNWLAPPLLTHKLESKKSIIDSNLRGKKEGFLTTLREQSASRDGGRNAMVASDSSSQISGAEELVAMEEVIGRSSSFMIDSDRLLREINARGILLSVEQLQLLKSSPDVAHDGYTGVGRIYNAFNKYDDKYYQYDVMDMNAIGNQIVESLENDKIYFVGALSRAKIPEDSSVEGHLAICKEVLDKYHDDERVAVGVYATGVSHWIAFSITYSGSSGKGAYSYLVQYNDPLGSSKIEDFEEDIKKIFSESVRFIPESSATRQSNVYDSGLLALKNMRDLTGELTAEWKKAAGSEKELGEIEFSRLQGAVMYACYVLRQIERLHLTKLKDAKILESYKKEADLLEKKAKTSLGDDISIEVRVIPDASVKYLYEIQCRIEHVGEILSFIGENFNKHEASTKNIGKDNVVFLCSPSEMKGVVIHVVDKAKDEIVVEKIDPKDLEKEFIAKLAIEKAVDDKLIAEVESYTKINLAEKKYILERKHAALTEWGGAFRSDSHVRENAYNRSNNAYYRYQGSDITAIGNQLIESLDSKVVIFAGVLGRGHRYLDVIGQLNILKPLLNEGKKVIVGVYNTGGNHWVAFRISKGSVEYKDSLGSTVIRDFENDVKKVLGPDAKFTSCPGREQIETPLVSCGLFALENMKIFAKAALTAESEKKLEFYDPTKHWSIAKLRKEYAIEYAAYTLKQVRKTIVDLNHRQSVVELHTEEARMLKSLFSEGDIINCEIRTKASNPNAYSFSLTFKLTALDKALDLVKKITNNRYQVNIAETEIYVSISSDDVISDEPAKELRGLIDSNFSKELKPKAASEDEIKSRFLDALVPSIYSEKAEFLYDELVTKEDKDFSVFKELWEKHRETVPIKELQRLLNASGGNDITVLNALESYKETLIAMSSGSINLFNGFLEDSGGKINFKSNALNKLRILARPPQSVLPEAGDSELKHGDISTRSGDMGGSEGGGSESISMKLELTKSTKSLQEAATDIEELKTENARLKAKIKSLEDRLAQVEGSSEGRLKVDKEGKSDAVAQSLVGNGTFPAAANGKFHSFFYQYFGPGIDEILSLRIDSLNLPHRRKIEIVKAEYFLHAPFTNVSDLTFKVCNSFTKAKQIVIAPFNLNSTHWVGLVFIKCSTGLTINYINSEKELMPQILKDEFKAGAKTQGLTVRFSERSVHKQKYRNCGAEVIENFVEYLTGKRVSQEEAILLHSALVEHSLMRDRESKMPLISATALHTVQIRSPGLNTDPELNIRAIPETERNMMTQKQYAHCR